ncbi:MAG: 4-hydroxy-3-methylbut-2-enyl diphosphate reductase [Anaeroplasma sp.]
MKVNKIEPQGFCGGVKYALKILDECINNTKLPQPIYLLGPIIHNSHVMNNYISKGIIVLNDKNKTRLELLDEINTGTVVFSAHGVEPNVYEKAKRKGLTYIDATCPNVKIIHNKIKEFLNQDYDCIYIGTKKHPELEGVIGISNLIHPIYDLNDVGNLSIINDKIYVTNQTTLSIYDIQEIFIAIKAKFPKAIIDDKICQATTIRQKAIMNQDPVDLCIIVGDEKSSNTKKLALTSEKNGIKTILCNDLESLDKTIFNNINSVSISSGASTPNYLVDEIIEYIKAIK